MLVFVYGTLKKNCGNHRLLEKAKYLGRAVTEKPMRLAGRGVPFTWPSNHAEGLKLQGEVYDIGDVATDKQAAQTLLRLDRLESNGHVYERKPHCVVLLENGERGDGLKLYEGEVLDDVWLYEAMEHVQRSYIGEAFERDEAGLVNAAGYLEWRSPYARTVFAGRDEEQDDAAL
jgi:gamma-glutamylcyclotransferase (GGCT)/AIG2-like uncharacterized protein YtfP